MNTSDPEKAQGHWLLAKMGKRVLRPGGRELSEKMMDALKISSNDDLVEFAPGIGKTASYLISKKPKTYTGIDADQDVVSRLTAKLGNDHTKFILSNAANTGLEENLADILVGEAMLTMHADHRKSEIVKEAHRILKKGGLYAIHELGLTPDSISEENKAEISKKLALRIKVNARPLTQKEWEDILTSEGFKIKEVFTSPMLLLERKRVVEDEGLLRSLKIGFNILTHPDAKKRILDMRSVFRKYRNNMNAVAIIAEKI
ncbi:MAG: class I SAM-dependent methyltransferase [Moheibacter sp.]